MNLFDPISAREEIGWIDSRRVLVSNPGETMVGVIVLLALVWRLGVAFALASLLLLPLEEGVKMPAYR